MTTASLISQPSRALRPAEETPRLPRWALAPKQPLPAPAASWWGIGCLFLLLSMPFTHAALLPKNFWVNPSFEQGTDLDLTTGTVANWNRGGNDPTICQVITNNAVGPGHALAVMDLPDGNLYGEWYSDVTLGDAAAGGDTLDIQWYELYNLAGSEMRLTVLFFNASDNVIGQTHFVTRGTASDGWVTTIEDSNFTKRNASLSVPAGAVKMRCSLVSGGSGTLTGVMIIDDLSVARAALPNVLFGNFWVNPAFELGANLNQTDGSVANWNRGGNSPTICQVLNSNFASSSHALAVVDSAPGDFYGEWYSDVSLSGNASPGDSLILQWFELYNLSGSEMRLTVLFFNATDGVVGETHFVTSGTASAGWLGSIGSSTFTKRSGSVQVPAGSVKMRCSLISGGPGTLTGVMLIDDLSVARVTPLVSGNFWVNSTFESGNNLDQPSGSPANWNRGGSDGTIDQVTTNAFSSPTHALTLVDSNTGGYGEWYSDVLLTGHAIPGDLLDVKWSELYSITDGEMRVTVGFFTAAGAFLSETHSVVSGNSPGWLGAVTGSPFTKRQQEVRVPPGAGKIRVAIVSAGPVATVGVLVLDDLTVALHPTTVLSGNFFPNPTFEEGEQLNNPTAAMPAGIWARGGSDGGIDQVSMANAVSPSHAFSLVDNNVNGYGEWYGFLPLSGVLPGDALEVQWFQLYNVANGGMRLTFAFTDAANGQLESRDFNVTGASQGWQGTIASSPFERQNHRLIVPEGTAKLRVNFASGGAASVTGVMLIDDLSVRIGRPSITAFLSDAAGFHLAWDSAPGRTYTVQYSATLNSWAPIATNLLADGLTTSYVDEASHSGGTGFYRVIQE